MTRLTPAITRVVSGYNEVRDRLIDIWGYPVLWQSVLNRPLNEYGEVPSYPKLSIGTEILMAFMVPDWVTILNTIEEEETVTGFDTPTQIRAGIRSNVPVKIGDRITVKFDYQRQPVVRMLEVIDRQSMPYMQQFTNAVIMARWRFSTTDPMMIGSDSTV